MDLYRKEIDAKLSPNFFRLIVDRRNVPAMLEGRWRIARGTLPEDATVIGVEINPQRGHAWDILMYSKEWLPVPLHGVVPSLDYYYDWWDDEMGQWTRSQISE